MLQLTIGEIFTILGFIVVIMSGILFLFNRINKKATKKYVDEQIKVIDNRVRALEAELGKIAGRDYVDERIRTLDGELKENAIYSARLGEKIKNVGNGLNTVNTDLKTLDKEQNDKNLKNNTSITELKKDVEHIQDSINELKNKIK
jgi:chromosome segregation ATPase